MKHLLFLANLIISCLFITDLFAQTQNVSKSTALSIAQKQFLGKDVDYYVLNNDASSVWKIFVDAEPTKGWQHDCYILTIPKSTTKNVNAISPTKEQRNSPPQEDYSPLLVKNRYGSNASSKPQVKKAMSSNQDNSVSNRTYAIILSGGINKNANYERYWNDCSFIYQTLVNKYNVPKGNIYPIMSDGNNPEKDMRGIYGEYKTQPLDLDYDGTNEIKLSATKSNIKNTLSTLANKLNKDDHLFFFVIDHGGTTDWKTNSYICLWNNENLYDYELASMLTPFTSKLVNVNVVLGQCFSGGFNDNLRKTGCVVASASKGSESSWACSDIPYDEFVYQWTCAVNEATHKGVPVESDIDNNKRVTMEEAFNYAKEHDRVLKENPIYSSTPKSVGEDLAFNNIAQSLDLFIKDNDEDTGKEPNTTTDNFWGSPSIWVRNQNDSICDHENPIYSSDHPLAFVNVRVHNRGKEDFKGGGKWVIVYWAQASTGLTAKAWKGREVYNGGWPTGGALEAHPIPEITSGNYKDFSIKWALPELLQQYPEGNFHFCLLAKISDKPYDDGYVDGKVYFNKRDSNDQAQKNVTIISKNDVEKFFNVYVRNTSTTDKSYTLELAPRTNADAVVFDRAKIEMSMSSKIYNAWERGGFKSKGIEIMSNNFNVKNPRTVKFVTPNGMLQNISLKGDEFDVVQLKFDFTLFKFDKPVYTLDLIQKDENGNIVGGETFVVEAPMLTLIDDPLIIVPDPIDDGRFQLRVNNANGFTNFKWIDGNGETLGNKETIKVTPEINGSDYTVIAMKEDGNVATQSISLKNSYGIESATPEKNNIIVNLKGNAPSNAVVSVKSLENGKTIASQKVPTGAKSINVEGLNLSNGIYVVCYQINATTMDQLKIKIQ